MRDNKGLSRRDFIKAVTAAGLAGVLSSPLISILNRSKASASSAQTAPESSKVRAWCMVIDLKKCEGCVTINKPPQCTQACVNGHYVPKGQEWIEVYTVELPGGSSYFMPTPCYHCENAPCVNVCPVAQQRIILKVALSLLTSAAALAVACVWLPAPTNGASLTGALQSSLLRPPLLNIRRKLRCQR